MKPNLLTLEGVNKRFNGIVALDNFTFSATQGEITGIIGSNGAGKTTLFNIITGFSLLDSGTIFFKNNNITNSRAYNISRLGVSRTFQNLRLIRGMSVIENILLSFHNQLGENFNNIFFRWKASEKIEKKIREKAYSLLSEADLTKKADDQAEALSYGQQKLLTILCCLAADADLLLLDEPVAGIAPEMTEKILNIIRRLQQEGKSVLLIEHNIDAIERVCDRVIFMETGKKICEGTPSEVRNDPQVLEAYLA